MVDEDGQPATVVGAIGSGIIGGAVAAWRGRVSGRALPVALSLVRSLVCQVDGAVERSTRCQVYNCNGRRIYDEASCLMTRDLN